MRTGATIISMITNREILKVGAADYLDARIVPEPNTGCWLWIPAVNDRGYAHVFYAGTKRAAAHRLPYELAKGPIRKGLVIDHICRTRSCLNPEHLRAVTSRENTLCGFGITARQADQTHCKRGHLFDEENTRSKRGWRECRKCRALLDAKYVARRKAAADRPTQSGDR